MAIKVDPNWLMGLDATNRTLQSEMEDLYKQKNSRITKIHDKHQSLDVLR